MNARAQGDEAPRALDTLLRAEMVHDAAVGIAGERSELYSAFAELWNRDVADVRASAERLIADGSPAGKVYGLLLLQKVDPAAAARAADEVGRAAEPVAVMQGCIVMPHELSELATHIVKAEHVIQLPPPQR
jgi:hypothetical protein